MTDYLQAREAAEIAIADALTEHWENCVYEPNDLRANVLADAAVALDALLALHLTRPGTFEALLGGPDAE